MFVKIALMKKKIEEMFLSFIEQSRQKGCTEMQISSNSLSLHKANNLQYLSSHSHDVKG